MANEAQALVVWAFFEGKSSQKHLGNVYKFEWF